MTLKPNTLTLLLIPPERTGEPYRFLVTTPSGRTTHVPVDEALGVTLRQLCTERVAVQKDPVALRLTRAGALSFRKTPDPSTVTLEDLGL